MTQGHAVGHANWMDGISYFQTNPIARLRMAAASCFFGEPAYYVDGAVVPARVRDTEFFVGHLKEVLGDMGPLMDSSLTTSQMMEQAIDSALAYDPEATLQVAVALRNEDLIRVTPQVIMVRAAHHPRVRGTSLIRQYAPEILKRGDEPATQLAYHNFAFGREAAVPNALKKAWRAYLMTLSEYAVAKYKNGTAPVKLVDVINLCRPTSAAVDQLMKGTLSLNESTWESYISANGSNPAAWQAAYDKFLSKPQGHMALLRNLRNLQEHEVLTPAVLEVLVAGAAQGKQLPFRYYSAYCQLKAAGATPAVLAALEACLLQSLKSLPRFEGRVMSLSDNSGSAQGTTTSSMGTMRVSTIGNLSALLTGLVADEGWLGLFGDELKRLPVSKEGSLFSQLDTADQVASRIGPGTENGVWLFFDQAIREKEHWDHIFIYSDMQAGHGGLYGRNPREYAQYLFPVERGGQGRYIDVAALVQKYRQEVNPAVMVYLVQVAGYGDTLMPEYYDKTYILGGWGPGLLQFAHRMTTVTRDPEPRETPRSA